MSKKPLDTDFYQQRLKTWPPKQYYTTFTFSILSIALGLIFIPTGSKLLSVADNVYESKYIYDGGSSNNCSITQSNQGVNCEVTFTIRKSITGPIYLYYELQNFYQNHRRYILSKSITQLQGQVLSQGDVELSCNPLYLNGTTLLNPCGLIANSFFNDVFTLNSAASIPSTVTLDETNIALPSDKASLFAQVQGFSSVSANCSASVTPTNSQCTNAGLSTGCKCYKNSATGQSYYFYYPNDDNTQYLYETYPNQISPLLGVTDEHFIVWMRTSSLPTFRKLYGKIDGNFNDGDQLVFGIQANYEVASFDGIKGLVISTLGASAGRNKSMGPAYITTGAISLAFGLIMLL